VLRWIRQQEKGLSEVQMSWLNPGKPDGGLPDAPTYDMMLTVDAVHDMARPDQVLPLVRKVAADRHPGTTFATVCHDDVGGGSFGELCLGANAIPRLLCRIAIVRVETTSCNDACDHVVDDRARHDAFSKHASLRILYQLISDRNRFSVRFAGRRFV
jgi:hypothetical protein